MTQREREELKWERMSARFICSGRIHGTFQGGPSWDRGRARALHSVHVKGSEINVKEISGLERLFGMNGGRGVCVVDRKAGKALIKKQISQVWHKHHFVLWCDGSNHRSNVIHHAQDCLSPPTLTILLLLLYEDHISSRSARLSHQLSLFPTHTYTHTVRLNIPSTFIHYLEA